MRIKYMPIKVGLSEAYQYSVDDGDTWISAGANVVVDIDPETVTAPNKKVMVRSSGDIQTIDPESFGLHDRLYNSINIKNGNSLLNIDNLFKDAVVKNIRVKNVDNVVSAIESFCNVIAETVDIGHLKSVNRLDSAFMNSIVGVLSDIKISEGQNYVDSTSNMFYYAKIGIMGDVEMKGIAIGSTYAMFYHSDIEFFPYIDMKLNMDKDSVEVSSRRHGYFMSHMSSRYMLEGVIREVLESGKSIDNSDAYMTYVGNSAYNFLSSSRVHFTGLTVVLAPRATNGPDYLFSMSSNLKTPLKSLSWSSYPMIRNASSTRVTYGNQLLTRYTQEYLDGFKTTGGHMYFPDWMEEVVQLESGQNQLLVNTTSLLVKGYDLEVIKGNKSYTSDTIGGYDSRFSNETPVATSADQVYGSRNGVRAYRNGTSVNIYDPNGDFIRAIEVPIGAISGNMSENGSELYLVYGQRYDTVAMGNQTLTGEIRIYDVATGIISEVVTVPMLDNEELSAVWKPNSTSGMQIMKRLFNGATGIAEMATVQRMYAGIYGEKITLSIVADNIFPNYWENAEFMCLNSTTGEFARCIGK